MARDFKTAIADRRKLIARDPLQDVDETLPGAAADPSVYEYGAPGRRYRRTFSQAIAEATRGVDAGMNRFRPQRPDLTSTAYAPDWRGHYLGITTAPVPRPDLGLATYKRRPSRVDELRRLFAPRAFTPKAMASI